MCSMLCRKHCQREKTSEKYTQTRKAKKDDKVMKECEGPIWATQVDGNTEITTSDEEITEQEWTFETAISELKRLASRGQLWEDEEGKTEEEKELDVDLSILLERRTSGIRWKQRRKMETSSSPIQ